MLRKILLPLLLFGFISVTADAQSFHASFSYQSFRPFVNFQLEIGNDRGYHDNYAYGYQNPYESAYIKGYMDGVNDAYYLDYRFYDMVRSINAYEAGYRDGVQDRLLYLRLKGYNRLRHQYFTYADYYSPYYSVQIWLNRLSFTFIEAPAYRLPRHWARRAHPRMKRYRAWAHGKDHHKRYRDEFRKYYDERREHLRQRSQYVQKQYRKNHRNYKRENRRGPSRLNRARAIQRVKSGGGRSSSVKNRSHSRTSRIQSRQPNQRVRIERSSGGNRPSVRARNHGKSRGGKIKSRRNSERREKVRSRSRRSKGGNGRVKRQSSHRSKGKRNRGGNRSRKGGRGGN